VRRDHVPKAEIRATRISAWRRSFCSSECTGKNIAKRGVPIAPLYISGGRNPDEINSRTTNPARKIGETNSNKLLIHQRIHGGCDTINPLTIIAVRDFTKRPELLTLRVGVSYTTAGLQTRTLKS